MLLFTLVLDPIVLWLDADLRDASRAALLPQVRLLMVLLTFILSMLTTVRLARLMESCYSRCCCMRLTD